MSSLHGLTKRVAQLGIITVVSVLVIRVIYTPVFAQGLNNDPSPATPFTTESQQAATPSNLDASIPKTESPDALIEIPLDIVYVQDETGSMGDDIAALRRLAPEVWDGIDSITTSEFRMSVIGFRDFAKSPWGNSSDHVYRLVGDFTSSRSQFVSAVNQLTASGGADTPESHYAALNYLLIPDHPCIDSNQNGTCGDAMDTPVGQQPTFRSGARRVILLATDANAHEPSETAGYPGPSRITVVETLVSSRAIVIGLVPGGPGAVPDTDDLANVTGGSVQSTGSTGDQVAAAIAAALGEIRPISPELSTVEVSPTSALANGSPLVTVKITVRDTGGNPVEGRSVVLRTTRPGSDIIVQPALLTDTGGQTFGYLGSIAPGTTQVFAAEAIDSVSFLSQPVVEFTPVTTPPGAALTNSINNLHNTTVRSNTRIGEITTRAGESGERLREAITEDSVEFAANIVFGFANSVKTVKDAAKPAFAMKYSGFLAEEGIGWRRITWLKEYYFTSGALFNMTFRDALRGDLSDIVIPTLIDGVPFYGAMLRDDVVENLSASAVEKLFKALIQERGGLAEAAGFAQQAADSNNEALNRQRNEVLSGIPPMTEAQQQAYARELQQRAPVPIVLDNLLWRQQFLIDNLEDARNSIRTNGMDLFLLKFSAKFLASAMFDGPGSALVDGYTTALDIYISKQKLEASSRAFANVPGLFKSSSEFLQRIYANEASGLDRVTNLLPPRPVEGRITSITQVSIGDSWTDFWKENISYSNVTIVNDDSERATFYLITEYDYEDKLVVVLPFARIPVNDTQAVTLNAGQTHTFRVSYKDEERGGTPIKNSLITFSLLGVNDSGTFFADSDSVLWNPTTLARSRANQRVILAEDVKTIENPLNLYVLGGVGESEYQAKLMMANPFTGTITTTVSLPIPSNAIVVDTDGVIAGNTVKWERSISASDIAVGNLTLNFPDASPGEPLILPAADMTFLEPGTLSEVSTESNTAEFEGAWPLDIQADIPIGEAGVSATIPVTVTNLIDDAQIPGIRLVLSQDSVVVHEEMKNINLDAHAQAILNYSLPANIRPGWYTIDIWATTMGSEGLFVSQGLYVEGDLSFIAYFPSVH